MLVVNAYSCTLDSFAFILDIDPFELVLECGHQGLDDEGKPIGFHIQELIETAVSRGCSVTPIERYPVALNPITREQSVIEFPGGNDYRFIRHLIDAHGVLTGLNANKNPHAVAWRDRLIHDPAGGPPYSLLTAGSSLLPAPWRFQIPGPNR